MAVRRLHLGGKYWRLLFQKTVLVCGRPCNGACTKPDVRNRTIYISRKLKGVRLLDTLIHEMLHALNWDYSDDCTTKAATTAASILWRSGYRAASGKRHVVRTAAYLADCLRLARFHLEADAKSDEAALEISKQLARLGYGFRETTNGQTATEKQ